MIQRQNNAQLSSSVVSLFDIIEVFGERAKERQGSTRAAQRPSELQKLINEFFRIKQRVDDQIIEILGTAGKDPLLKGATLNAGQKSLRFDKLLVPNDSSH